MPEEDLETSELKEQIDQRLEEHEHHAHAHAHAAEAHKPPAQPSWVRYLSLSTAMIAVIAAVASLESGARSNEAILEKSEAMLNQSKASDRWAFYQAKSVKAAIAEGEAKIIDGKPEIAAELNAKVTKYKAEEDEIQKEATKLEEDVEKNNHASEHLMHKHHFFAYTVTMLQIAIALSAIAALTRKQPLWFLGLAVSAGGLGFFAYALMQ